MNDVMLDLETMGSGPQAAIVAIGAVEFDLDAGSIGERFYEIVDLASAVDQGGQIDSATVLWWLKQGEEARAELQRPGSSIGTVLWLFADWLAERAPEDQVRVWANSPAFDCVILRSAYAGEAPWSFRNDRCYRTVRALHPDVPAPHLGVVHQAVNDAERQARHLVAMLAPKRAAPDGEAQMLTEDPDHGPDDSPPRAAVPA